jgi:hypothetical protein
MAMSGSRSAAPKRNLGSDRNMAKVNYSGADMVKQMELVTRKKGKSDGAL